MGRSYQDAIAALNTLQTNFSVVNAIKKSGGRMNELAIPEMLEWVRRIGYEPHDFDQLSPIHIAGTKGKGSTSAFLSWILAQYLPSPSQRKPLFHKIGLFTSPHLRFVRERIQINNEPLSEEIFAKYFFETWDRLEASVAADGLPPEGREKPVYFRFLTLMAFHTFMSEGVDTAIIECGIGGEYDSTNFLKHPSCTGISSLGIDHTALLGDTIESIAWHKAGIIKYGAPAFTAPQPPSAIEVIQTRANEISTPLHLVPIHPDIQQARLGLAGDFQKTNASLAAALAASHLQPMTKHHIGADSKLPAEFLRGLEQTRLQGRCETRRDGKLTWHLDCGHTLESIEVAGKWFASQIQPSASAAAAAAATTTTTTTAPKPTKQTRILLFNQQTRDANALVTALHATLKSALDDDKPFTHAVFCTNVTFATTGYKPEMTSMNVNQDAVQSLEVQKGLADAWKRIDSETQIQIEKSIEGAITWCRDVAKQDGGEVAVLVTGSVHLVGGVLEILES